MSEILFHPAVVAFVQNHPFVTTAALTIPVSTLIWLPTLRLQRKKNNRPAS
jgi:hypothetical protein